MRGRKKKKEGEKKVAIAIGIMLAIMGAITLLWYLFG